MVTWQFSLGPANWVLDRVAVSIDNLRALVNRAQGRREALASKLRQTETAISDLEDESSLLVLVGELLRKLIDQEVTVSVEAVEKLQTEGLQAVFPDQKISVKSNVDVSRGKVSVDLITSQDHGDGIVIEGSSNDSFGGAVTTVQSILLRILITLRRGLRPVLLLDETLPAFDSNYVANMAQFLSLVCKRMGVDILLVTHNPALVEAADHAYRINRRKGVASFEATR